MTASRKLFQAFLRYRSVSTDSRNILPDSIFFAIKGENFNGNLFAADALQKGAAIVVVDQPLDQIPEDRKIEVPDVLKALQQLATEYRKQLKTTIVGLTGSNGKTTCKELFREVLSQSYRTVATSGNLNNHIGVPLTILSIPENAQFAVVEMGANHQREIAMLSEICRPDIGYITNFGKAHLEGFGGVDGVIKGKSELYDFLRSNHKKALVNCADSKQLEKSEGVERITFGNCAGADVVIRNLNLEIAGAEIDGTVIHSQLTGDFHFINIAAAVALGRYFNVPLELIQKAIEAYSPRMNRSEWRRTGSNEVLMDAYNANPDSMQASIQAFARLNKENKWCVLGDMFELGDYAEEEHQYILNLLQSLDLKNVVLVGPYFYAQNNNNLYSAFQTTEEALSYFNNQKLKNATVLLKGSRGMKLEKLIEVL
jgi:UDP-N-acetylmuramoyl-tripeptide--D-alanyl-D-alanine ligase